jgi:5-methylcytosine-specific restriction endonuclease McrA
VCQFPGCNQPAKRCDLDHRTPWQNGGTTCPDNLTALCRRHHRAKHGPWILRRNLDGSITWISPTGKHYHQPPPSYDDP